MSKLAQIFAWFYNQSLKLYPVDFRAEFETEMQRVFFRGIEERVRDSITQALVLCLREIKDLPGSLYHQHRIKSSKEGSQMNKFSKINDIQQHALASTERHPGTWGEAFLAGLPHLLMGLLIGVGKIITPPTLPSQTNNAIAITMLLLVVTILIVAWRRAWPLWSASWYLYGIWVSMAIISLAIQNLALEDGWRYTNAVFLGWILVCFIGYFVIMMKSKLHALLAIFFLFPLLGILLLEFIPNPIEGWVAIFLGLLSALTAGIIVRLGDFRIGLGLVLGVNLLAGLAIAYISEYKMLDLPAGIPAHVPRFFNFMGLLVFYTIIALGVIAAPFILRGLWSFAKRTRFT
jgi:hypothetical protein